MIVDWLGSPKRSHTDVIMELLSPIGSKVIDIGCGTGKMTRTLTEMGAEVIGIDPSQHQLERARGAARVGGEIFIEGVAENLPFDDQSIDAALFFNSFHHLPKEGFQAAIIESHRVLREGGKLYFTEPIADGPQFELSRLVNDESEIRALAYTSIGSAPDLGFKAVAELIYITENRHKDFEAYKRNSTSINPAREALFEQHDEEIRTLFESTPKRMMMNMSSLCQFVEIYSNASR